MIAINLNIDYVSGRPPFVCSEKTVLITSFQYFHSQGFCRGDCNGNEAWMSLFRYGGNINLTVSDKEVALYA